jgi:sporulation protein YunB
MSEITARLIATQAINDAVGDVIANEKYRDLAIIIKDNAGKIAGVHANTIEINRIAGETTTAVQTAIENIGKKSLKIPISNIFSSQIFANTGPRININILPAGSVSVDYYTDFESAGINQTRHKIYLTISTTIRIIAPLTVNSINVTTNIPVSETIIVGDVPDSYISVPRENGEYMNFIPNKDPFDK